MTPNKKKVMLPHTMAKAGWDVLTGRDDIDVVGYDPYITMPDLRVAARIGVGYDAVEIPALTARGIPLMVVGTANSVSVAEHAIFMMYALAKRAMFQDAAVRDDRWQDRWKDVPVATIKAAGYEPVSDLDAAVPRADIVCIHCPKSPETIGMFNAARIARM